MWSRVIENIDVHPLAWVAVCVVTLIAAVTDLHSRRIHNILTVPFFAAGLLWALGTGGLIAAGEGLAAAMLLGFPFVVLFFFAGGGAGDAKLMMALGPWVGFSGGVLVLATVTISGLFLALGWAIRGGRVREMLNNLGAIAIGLFGVARRVFRLRDVPRVPEPEKMNRMPYGLAICLGVWISAGGMVLWNVQP